MSFNLKHSVEVVFYVANKQNQKHPPQATVSVLTYLYIIFNDTDLMCQDKSLV